VLYLAAANIVCILINITYLVVVGLFFEDGSEFVDDVFRQSTYGLGDCSEHSVRNTPL
jgi:hypothetical protein